jgi:hypothetical protein
LVYENNPLYGYRFDREIGSGTTLENAEVTFSAFPLFFGAITRDSRGLGYQWGTNSGDTQDGNNVTYRIPEGSSGTSQVTVHAYNKYLILEDIRRKFLLEFGNESNI